MPNPVQDRLFVRISSDKPRNLSVRILGLSGQTLATRELSLSEGDNHILFQTTGWPSGAYVLSHTTDSGEAGTSRFVKR
jgi:hypothetical protein